jgi:5-methylcytosine-specific restriction enzyme subunit McrC
MQRCDKIHTITEYGGFTCGAAIYGYQGLPEKTFDALEAFILANNTNDATEAIELLSLTARRGVGKIITAKNYVGLITMTDGTVIEILPKIIGESVSTADAKRLFLDMLKSLREVTFKDFNVSNLRTDRLNLFEIFIRMFFDEVAILTKQGLKSAYTPVENNERYYRGKLIVSENIRLNLVNKERFFLCYDDFKLNRPENRLIKSTLAFLLKTTTESENRQSALRLLTFFDGVDYSGSYDSDFSKCVSDRNMNHYTKVISWCRIFLKGNSFTAFAGSEVALALLFPMEKIFESYIAAKFRKHLKSGMRLRTQDTKYSLFDEPHAFNLRPDLVFDIGGRTVIMDTKWKLLSDNVHNNGILQSDMYQMYAYSKKYNADRIVLLYPHTDGLSETDIIYSSNDNVIVEVKFINLLNTDRSIKSILDSIALIGG